jgi:hypothetical protein
VRRPELSAGSGGASRSLQQRRPNQGARGRRGQTNPETPRARNLEPTEPRAGRCGVLRVLTPKTTVANARAPPGVAVQKGIVTTRRMRSMGGTLGSIQSAFYCALKRRRHGF